MSSKKALLGALFWAGLAVAVTAAVRSISPEPRRALDHVKAEMARALFAPAPTYVVDFDAIRPLERGNGVLAVVNGRLERLGEVVMIRRDVRDVPGVRMRVWIALDHARGDLPVTAGTRATCRSQERSFIYAVRTLLPEAERREIQEEWQQFWRRHDRELLNDLEPVLRDLLEGGARVIADEVAAALERHRAELDPLLARLRTEIGRDQILPLLAQELWPIVVQRGSLPAERIGRELWERAPLASFAWRAAADKVLSDRNERVEERWKAFLAEEALPTLRQHEPELEAAFLAILRDVLASDAVQARSKEIVATIAGDPAVKQLAATLVREAVFENERFRAFVAAFVKSPAVQQRLHRVSAALQQFLDQLGNRIFLDRAGQGINRNLAYLLRLLLLNRDAQLIYLEPGDGALLAPGATIPGLHER